MVSCRRHVARYDFADLRQILQDPYHFGLLEEEALIARMHLEEAFVRIRHLVAADGRRWCPDHGKLGQSEQGWCLPHATARQHFEERPAGLRAILRPSRTRLPHAAGLRQVLDAHHAGINSLLNRYLQRHMSRDGELLLPRLVHNCKEHLAWRVVVDLDQIHAAPLQELYRGSALIRVSDAHPERPVTWRIVEDRSCCDNSRTERPT